MRPTLDSYTHLAGGKVRDLYTIDDEHLLLVASDRISAYDHVLSTPIPDKGRVLTAMSVFFFNVLGGTNHLAGEPDDDRIPEEVLGRALVVRSLDMVPVECVVRGFLTGSGLVDYNNTGAVCGVALPEGLVEASRLPDPIFTPASKAALGDHDENISFDQVVEKVGQKLAVQLREDTLDVYARASNFAADRGIILADTKLEFRSRLRWKPRARRRGAHPRLVALLASRRLRSGQGTAQFRQAVRARLAHEPRIRLGP